SAGGRGDDARPARRSHRLRPVAGDDGRDARRHRPVAAAVRVIDAFSIDSLLVHVSADVDDLARAAAADAATTVNEAVAARGVANVMLATGNSQLAFLDVLAGDASIEWTRVVAFHMDEYVGLPPSHPASFQRYMRERVAA